MERFYVTLRHRQVFLTVLASVAAFRLLWVHLGAGELPFWDQWDAEGWLLYRAWQEGELGLAALLSPHNEHRILWPRLTALLLFILNNQHWDNLVTASFSALFVAVLAACLAQWAHPRLTPSLRGPLILVLLFLACLPIAWENLISGFQIAFFQMLLFSLLGLGLAVHAAAGWRLALGLLACLAAGLFTVASGLLAPAVAALVVAWRVWRSELPRTWLMVVLFLLALTSLGYALIPPMPLHDALKAQSLADLMRALLLMLSWPFPIRFPVGLVLWLAPLLWLPGLLRRQVPPPPRLVVFAVAISAWVALQAVAMAYSRGHEATAIASRYLDLLGLGCLVNLMLWLAWSQSRVHAGVATGARLLAIALFGAVAVALGSVAIDGVSRLGGHREIVSIQTRNVHAYLGTGDFSHLADKPLLHIPYPDPNRLRMFLDDPSIRNMLPGTPGQAAGAQAHRRAPLGTLSRLVLKASPLAVGMLIALALAVWLGRILATDRPKPP